MFSAGLHAMQVPKEDSPNIPPELMASLNISAEVCFARRMSNHQADLFEPAHMFQLLLHVEALAAVPSLPSYT